MALNIKNEVLYRIYFVLFGLVIPFAALLCYQTVKISFLEGDKWREEGKRRFVDLHTVEAERGNILTEDGSLLATSLPFFDIAFDPNSSGMKAKDFEDNIDSLAHLIATRVDNSYTVGGYADFLRTKREEKVEYVPIKKNATFSQMKEMSQFPLFNRGQYRGGFIVRPKFVRKTPFGILAHRTVGSIRENAKPVGLEGKMDKVLKGEEGKQLMVKVDSRKDIWIPLDDLTAIEPKRGDDVVTTIDINLQDIAENALIKGMDKHNAEWGTAIVMEVETGAIKAIANIGQTTRGWWETYNYAVGFKVEPGSTFKLASIMALLEDEAINLTDTIRLEYGKTQFYEEEMVDATRASFKLDSTTVHHAFEISSNVGIAKLIHENYGLTRRGKQFIDRLKQFHLNIPTGVEIEGEGMPFIKDAYNEKQGWSGTTLPWMAIGYELELTPLQTLNFYNTVANGGMMMKPYLVSSIQRFGETIEQFVPTVMDKKIATKGTIRKAQMLLESVVENGTAKSLKSNRYRFAGKTGTAQADYQRTAAGRIKVGGHRASFAGYFPAEKPKYSCIVVVNDPKKGGIYGGEVAGPIFREIADDIMLSEIDLQKVVNANEKPTWTDKSLPSLNIGEENDIKKVLSYLDIPYKGNAKDNWAVIRPMENTDSIKVLSRRMPDKTVPNVVGMGLRDAMYILENRGLKVTLSGVGKVRRQSIKPGTRIQGQTMKLTLG